MTETTHNVMIFVFRRILGSFEYLILRHEPEHEGFWCPLKAEVGPGETLQLAAIREAERTLLPPSHKELIDLNYCEHLNIGDFDTVDWALGLGTGSRSPDVQLGEEYREYLWAPIERVFPMVEEEASRRAMMKLHFRLAAG